MEKSLSKISFSSFAPLLRRLTMEGSSGNFLWRVVLGFALVLAVGSAFFAWLLYSEVTTESTIPPSSKHRTGTLSIDELREVVGFYQKKEAEFKTLQDATPEAPTLDAGSGVSTSVSPDQNVEQVVPL